MFLSLYLGLISVTIYSNYYYIFTTVFAFVNVLLNAIAAGLGDYVPKVAKQKWTLLQVQIGQSCKGCI